MIRGMVFAGVIFLFVIASAIPHGYGASDRKNNPDSLFRVPSYVQEGDFLFCDVNPLFTTLIHGFDKLEFSTTKGFSNDHVAMYIGRNRFIEANAYRYRPFQQNWLGVVTTPYWFFQLWASNITFGFVTNATIQEKQDAIAWAKQQLGSPYQFGGMHPNPNPQDSEDVFSDWWFCSELVWAAYYNQGVPISMHWGHHHFNASYVRALRIADNVKMYTNIAPTADSGGPYTGVVNESVYFYGFESSDIDGMILEYYWDFGDEGNSSGPFTSHLYTQPGDYVVQLTVIDNAGAVDKDTTTVHIS